MDPTLAIRWARAPFFADLRGLMPRVRKKSLVVRCTDDLIAPVTVGHWLQRPLPNGTLAMLPASGHSPHVSYPDGAARVLTDWLEAAGAAEPAPLTRWLAAPCALLWSTVVWPALRERGAIDEAVITAVLTPAAERLRFALAGGAASGPAQPGRDARCRAAVPAAARRQADLPVRQRSAARPAGGRAPAGDGRSRAAAGGARAVQSPDAAGRTG